MGKTLSTFLHVTDGGRYSSPNASLTIPSPLITSEQQLQQIRGNIPLSTAITTVINSSGAVPTSMVQNFTTPQHQVNLSSEEGIAVMPNQQPTTSMIPIPSVTLRTLVLDLLGKYL